MLDSDPMKDLMSTLERKQKQIQELMHREPMSPQTAKLYWFFENWFFEILIYLSIWNILLVISIFGLLIFKIGWLHICELVLVFSYSDIKKHNSFQNILWIYSRFNFILTSELSISSNPYKSKLRFEKCVNNKWRF